MILEHTNVSYILNNKNIISYNNNSSNPQTEKKSVSDITSASRKRTEFLNIIFLKRNIYYIVTTIAFIKDKQGTVYYTLLFN